MASGTPGTCGHDYEESSVLESYITSEPRWQLLPFFPPEGTLRHPGDIRSSE